MAKCFLRRNIVLTTDATTWGVDTTAYTPHVEQYTQARKIFVARIALDHGELDWSKKVPALFRLVVDTQAVGNEVISH